MKWRKWNNILHRDIGYLAAGLTIIYAISGIAVNHVGDWNPNYHIENVTFTANIPESDNQAVIVKSLLNQLNINKEVESVFRPSPDKINIYLENHTIAFDLSSGTGSQEIVSERDVLFDFNYLHLNHPKKLWTYFADLYAVALAFLAISGLFVLKGKKGIKGRGAWLTGIGILLPVLFLVIYKYWN